MKTHYLYRNLAYTNPLGAYKIFFNNGNLQSQASDRNAGCTVRPVRASQE